MRINSARGLLREFGLVFPLGADRFCNHVRGVIEDAESSVPMLLRELLHQLVLEIGELETRIKPVEKHLTAIAEQTPVIERLRTIPGVGLLTATRVMGFPPRRSDRYDLGRLEIRKAVRVPALEMERSAPGPQLNRLVA
jgi:transposase